MGKENLDIGRTVDLAESPVIKKPADPSLVEKLQRKSAEYEKRFVEIGDSHMHPGQVLFETVSAGYSGALDAVLKRRLLDEVLEVGEVKTWDYTNRMVHDPLFEAAFHANPSLFAEVLDNACAVIDTYCTGGDGNRDGTGIV